MAAILTSKRLELLKETIPAVSRVAVLWDPQLQAPCPSGKKVNCRRGNSVCNCIR